MTDPHCSIIKATTASSPRNDVASIPVNHGQTVKQQPRQEMKKEM
jgi:hypothetical protein